MSTLALPSARSVPRRVDAVRLRGALVLFAAVVLATLALWPRERAPAEAGVARFGPVVPRMAGISDVVHWTDAATGQAWLVVTNAQADGLVVYDATSGRPLQWVGGAGDESGRFADITGLSTADNLLFVAERGNRRVQVLSLPHLLPLATLPLAESTAVAGVRAVAVGAGRYRVCIDDGSGRAPCTSVLDWRQDADARVADGD